MRRRPLRLLSPHLLHNPAADPGTKVAVRIWAVEVLKHCRERVGWVAEAWDDLVETMAHGATPGIECRMRKSWKPGRSDKA